MMKREENLQHSEGLREIRRVGSRGGAQHHHSPPPFYIFCVKQKNPPVAQGLDLPLISELE